MRRRVLNIFVLLFVIAAVMPALAQTPPLFTAIYWVKGTVNPPIPQPAGFTVDGRTVIFYRVPPGVSPNISDVVGAGGLSGTSGKYMINIFNSKEIEIDPTDPIATYYVAVMRDPVDNYGADPVHVPITGNGFEIVDLTLVEGGGPTVGGLIRNTRIYWDEDGGIHLEWDYAPEVQPPQVDIWRLKGDVDANTEYSTVVAWDLYKSARGGTQFQDTELEVGDGINAYYRIVPAGTDADDIFLPEMNNETVGKVDVLLRSEYNAISSPFKATNYGIRAVIGNQLNEGDQIHYWSFDNQAYRILTKTNQWPDYTFKIVEGFFVYLTGQNREERLTLVGEVGGFAPTFFWPLGKEYNLLGYPYPKSGLANTIGFAPREGDQIHRWNWDGQSFTLTTFVNNTWKDEEITRFSLSEGKFYYIPVESDGYDWTPIF